jgi:hypothetical protein
VAIPIDLVPVERAVTEPDPVERIALGLESVYAARVPASKRRARDRSDLLDKFPHAAVAVVAVALSIPTHADYSVPTTAPTDRQVPMWRGENPPAALVEFAPPPPSSTLHGGTTHRRIKILVGGNDGTSNPFQ